MGRPKLGEGDTQRLHVKVDDAVLTAIDDWRFANRIASRSSAIRRLMFSGIQIEDDAPHIAERLDAALTAMARAVGDKTGPEILAAANAVQDLADAIAPTLHATKTKQEHVPSEALNKVLEIGK